MEKIEYKDYLVSALTINLVFRVVTIMGLFMPKMFDAFSFSVSLLVVNFILLMVLILD
jgi:hypothetical protein